jgi:hypothetical protein
VSALLVRLLVATRRAARCRNCGEEVESFDTRFGKTLQMAVGTVPRRVDDLGVGFFPVEAAHLLTCPERCPLTVKA